MNFAVTGRQTLFLSVLCLVITVGCKTTTTFSATKPTSYASYEGKVIVLTTEQGKDNVPGAEEIGVVRAEGSVPWTCHSALLKGWKKEAARHGANAVKWNSSGMHRCGWRETVYAEAKAYRIPNVDDPQIKPYIAPPSATCHD